MHKYTVILFSARTMDNIAFHEGTVYMFEDTGLDVSHEVYGGREGQTACWGNITSCQGNNYGVSRQITACRGNNYGVPRQITVCRGKLRRVGANYVVSGQITSCRGNNYVVSRQITSVSRQITACQGQITACQGQITSCQGKLRRVGENCVVSGQITSCRGKLRRVGANYGVIHAHKLLITVVAPCIHDYVGIYWKNEEKSTPLFS